MIPGGPGSAAIVLLVVLLVGVAAGRAKRRLSLLLVGVVAVVGLGVLVTATGGPDPDQAAAITRLYVVALPPLVAFVAGWLCGRATWLMRLVVIGVAAVLLAAFPYDAAGQATARFLGPGVTAVG